MDKLQRIQKETLIDNSLVKSNDVWLVSQQGTQISKHNRIHSEDLKATLYDLIKELPQYFACPTTFLSTSGIRIAVEHIIGTCWFYKLEDIVLMLNKAKKGEYGKIYHLDIQTLNDWFNAYDTARDEVMVINNRKMAPEMKDPLQDVDYEAYKKRMDNDQDKIDKTVKLIRDRRQESNE